MSEQTAETAEVSPPPQCPKCSGDMWDNRVGKKNPKAPDFKCKDRSCDGVIWPPRNAAAVATPAAAAPGAIGAHTNADGLPNCPICGGPMWDDRLTKRNPKAPDFKCRNKPKERGGPGCEGIIWPPRNGAASPYPAPVPRAGGGGGGGGGRQENYGSPPPDDTPPPTEPPPFFDDDNDDLPF